MCNQTEDSLPCKSLFSHASQNRQLFLDLIFCASVLETSVIILNNRVKSHTFYSREGTAISTLSIN